MPRIHRLALAATLVLLSTVAAGSPLDLPNVPPDVSSSVDPNIMFLLDDSGSMQGEDPARQRDPFQHERRIPLSPGRQAVRGKQL